MIIRTIAETAWLGKKWCHLETIDSTNLKAKELAEAGCPHGTIVTADVQTAGVGRRGRTWLSEDGKGIYMSIVLRPQMETEKASMLTLVAAVAVAKAIQMMTQDAGFLPFIKWPNDIVIRGKKVCGILTEMSVKEKEIDYIIVGIGINVQHNVFPIELQQMATTLEKEAGYELSKERLFELIVQQFESYYSRFMEELGIDYILEEYQSRLANKGRKVTVLDPVGQYEGMARGITNTGELIVDTPDGTRYVSAGEVSVRGIYGYV